MSAKKKEDRSAWIFYRRVFRGIEVVNSAVLREVSLTARGVLSHRVLDSKL